MDWMKLKQLREERAAKLAEMKSILKQSEDEKRDLTSEEHTAFDALNTRAEAIKSDIERWEAARKLETELAAKGEQRQQPGREDVNTPEQKAGEQRDEQRQQFDRYLRGTSPMELRALTVAGTGVVGPRAFYDQLIVAQKSWAGVRQAGATVLPTTDGNPLTIPTADDTANVGQIVAEGATNNANADPALGNVTLGAYRFDSKWVKVSQEMLRDTAFPIEQYIIGIAGERIGRIFNQYATTGTGTGQPRGFVTAGTVGKTAAATNAITYEELLDLIHSVDAGYRGSPNFRLQLHDTTLAAVRKLKDGAGRYIFSSATGGAPSTILDIPYVVNNDLATLSDGASSTVVAAGDFSRYFIRDVTAVEVVRANELFIGDGLVGFRVFQRADANLADTKAVKLLKLAA
jgi:HK97 family phage major capsid protein